MHTKDENMGGPGGEAPRKKKNSNPQIKIFEIFSQTPFLKGGYPKNFFQDGDFEGGYP